MAGSLRLERDAGLAVITLDRPDVLNAFDETLTAALASAVDEVAKDGSVRAVVITGAGRAFSAGQDLRDRLMLVEAGKEDLFMEYVRAEPLAIVTWMDTQEALNAIEATVHKKLKNGESSI